MQLAVGGAFALALTVAAVRHPVAPGYGLPLMATFWVVLGGLPLLFAPGAHTRPVRWPYLALVAGGLALGRWAARRWRSARGERASPS